MLFLLQKDSSKETSTASIGNDDILAKVRGLLKRVPGCTQSKRQPDANSDVPPAEASSEKHLLVKDVDDTVKTDCMPCALESDVTIGVRLTNQDGSDGLSYRPATGPSVSVSVQGGSDSLSSRPTSDLSVPVSVKDGSDGLLSRPTSDLSVSVSFKEGSDGLLSRPTSESSVPVSIKQGSDGLLSRPTSDLSVPVFVKEGSDGLLSRPTSNLSVPVSVKEGSDGLLSRPTSDLSVPVFVKEGSDGLLSRPTTNLSVPVSVKEGSGGLLSRPTSDLSVPVSVKEGSDGLLSRPTSDLSVPVSVKEGSDGLLSRPTSDLSVPVSVKEGSDGLLSRPTSDLSVTVSVKEGSNGLLFRPTSGVSVPVSDQNDSDGLPCRPASDLVVTVPVSVPTKSDAVNTTPAAIVSAAYLSNDSSLSGTDHRGPCNTGRDGQNKSVRKPRKTKPTKVRVVHEETATASPLQRRECPVTATTVSCQPVDNSPEKMHPEILNRLRTDLKLVRSALPVVTPLIPTEPAVVLNSEEQPLDLSKTVWPTMLPLDLSTKGTGRRDAIPDRTFATATFANSQPRPPALCIRTPSQKVSPVRPVQRQPESRMTSSERVAAAAKAGFHDGTMLHKFLSQRVRTAVDKLQLNNGLDRRDTANKQCYGRADSTADSRCDRTAGKTNGELKVATYLEDTGTSGSQRISRIAFLLAQRLGYPIPASKPRSSWGNGPSPGTTQRRTASDGAFQSRFTASRSRARRLKPPLAEVRPISACPPSPLPDTALRQAAPADWRYGQQGVSHNVGLVLVEPPQHSLPVKDDMGQIGQTQRQFSARLGAKTYNVSMSPTVVRTTAPAVPAPSHDVITIIDTSPVLATTKPSSGRSVLAALMPTVSEASTMGKSQEVPSLSPPQLHMISPPSVAGSDVCNTATSSQMPQLSPHADESTVDLTESRSRRSDAPMARRSMSPPSLLVYEAAGPSPVTNSCRAVHNKDAPGMTSSVPRMKSMPTSQSCAVAAANPNMDLAVFMPTKPFSMDFFSRCVDTWVEDIARPSKVAGFVRHRSTFDIGRTNYYKNTILCQQTPATTSLARPGGRNPVAATPSWRGVGDADAHETCRQYHRDCRLPASIIASLPTLPVGDERRSPKMARTVASMKRAVTANVEAVNTCPSPAKTARMGVGTTLHQQPDNSATLSASKMARTVASVKHGLRAGRQGSKPALDGLARKDTFPISQLNAADRQDLDRDPPLSTSPSAGADLSDPELNCSSARYGYARKAFVTYAVGGSGITSIVKAVRRVETLPKEGSGTKRIAVLPKNEPVVNNYTNSKARSGKSPPRRRSSEKPKTSCNKRLASQRLLTHADFPQLDACAVEKAILALVMSTQQTQEPAHSGPSVAKKGRLSSRDDRQHLTVSDKPSPLPTVVVTIRKVGEESHRDSTTAKHADKSSPAMARTISKIILRHSYPVVKLERVEAGPDQTKTWKCVTRRSPKSGGGRPQRSGVRRSPRSAGRSAANPIDVTSPDNSGMSVRGTLRRPPTDRRISSSSSGSSSCGSQHPKRRSLLDELSNTDGYIADETRHRSSVDLFADPSTLSREERALQVRDSPLSITH